MKTSVFLGLLSTVQALPSFLPPAAPGVSAAAAADPNACGVVAEAFSKQKAANPKASARVSSAQAFACLQSVPNKPEPAVKLVNSVKAYAQWQSTLPYLKNPPAAYGLPPTDILGGLDAIKANATTGAFASEYEFQKSMLLLFGSAHDGHFGYRPDVFKAFAFRNDLVKDLVSVSADGLQTPKLYNFAVLNGSSTTVGNVSLPLDANGFPPAVTKINGQEAATFLTNQGLSFINTQDLDAQWNVQLQSYASPDALPPIAASSVYQGDSVTVEYSNGQTITQESYALVRAAADFTGIKTGEDFYKKFCTPAAAAAPATPPGEPAPATPTTPPRTPEPTLPGFPTPMIRDNGANATAGYFLTGAGYEDVAVLSVLGFAPQGGDTSFSSIEYLTNLQAVVQDFLGMCKTAGKKKLIVDVSANGGGLVVAGYELYSQLFPGNPIFQANNLRRADSLVQVAEIADANMAKIQGLTNADIGPNATQESLALLALIQSPVMGNLINLFPGSVKSAADRIDLNTTQQIIASVPLAGDSFTTYQSTPQNQPSPTFNLTGSGSRSNPGTAVFTPENVVIMTDGSCGSTCTLFSYLMIMQSNIKTIAVGGRPQTGSMQSMGGVEGAQVFKFEDINQVATAALILSTPQQRATLNGSDIGLIAEGYALDRAAAPGSAGVVNGKNAFSHVDAETPLQFLSQPANCRFFYTKEMVKGPEATWRRAADAAFTSPDKFCVQGSQQPLMGVQAPTNAFFVGGAAAAATGSATGAVTVAGAVAQGVRMATVWAMGIASFAFLI